MRRESGSDTQRDEIGNGQRERWGEMTQREGTQEIGRWRAREMERHDTETQREEIEKWRLKGMERHDTIYGERRSRNGVHER